MSTDGLPSYSHLLVMGTPSKGSASSRLVFPCTYSAALPYGCCWRPSESTLCLWLLSADSESAHLRMPPFCIDLSVKYLPIFVFRECVRFISSSSLPGTSLHPNLHSFILCIDDSVLSFQSGLTGLFPGRKDPFFLVITSGLSKLRRTEQL